MNLLISLSVWKGNNCGTEKRIDPPTLGMAVCFPDMFVGDGPTQDDLRGLVIGEEGSGSCEDCR